MNFLTKLRLLLQANKTLTILQEEKAMQPDKWYLSYRTYAAILSTLWVFLKLFQIDVPVETQSAVDEAVKKLLEAAELVLPAIAGLLAAISKLKELIKTKGAKI